ncbi:sugar ABC transporter ATP-binding protein [Pseudohaliea rubra]|uniref:Ribose ABC transport system, ATP-binding protein RbsA n=1 Tax=Pseudohaliea rubra DSM 19751 TaxID=1265313 RepID=A0A095VRI2_9GAMM|nr:sugar ABC transporter ATP-binding protein [Pseudohaliea rubra]KGE03683.1 Ribose ABC transport system, ATP-binding protein RbsA [Pseudohaliea rubra DSM 19751]
METLLSVRGLHKAFAAPVLRGIDFTVRRGEIHALMGSNGAGKSTLCNIIAGLLAADAGALTLGGRPHRPRSLREAEALGVRMVMQELNLFPTLSIAENLCFQRLGNGLGLLSRRRLAARAEKALARVGLAGLNPSLPVARLGVGQRQLLEIARALADEPALLILDEPTASLTDPQIHRLFGELRRLREAGAGIIYISHRMDEICQIADRVSVLRDGELVATAAAADLDSDRIVELMAGAPLERPARGASGRAGAPLLRVEGLGRDGAFADVSFTLHAGEVLGIAGLIGAGRTELLRAIFGADPADRGSLRLATDGFATARRFRRPADAMAAGIGLVVEDRRDQGLLLPLGIDRNISLASYRSLQGPLGLVKRSAETALAARYCDALAVRCAGTGQPVRELSGGNQQKVLIARWLARDFPVLLFDEPGRGVDASAKARIHHLIREAARAGRGVVVVSSENDELFAVSDRILALSRGRVAGDFDAATVTEEALLAACFRHHGREEQNRAATL